MNIAKIKKLDIPKAPGCYQFLNKKGEIIYIGKAANLKSRVLSYLPAMRAQAGQVGWRKSINHSPAKYSMLKQVFRIEWIKTESEIEALLLEANLVKKYQPQYNVVLRDDKRYVYIKISSEVEWPRIFMTRQLEKSGKYFGPFVSVEAVRETLKVIRKIWPYRSCRSLPKKTCLYYRIGKCPGMCENKISKQEYKQTIKQIILFLSGKKKQVIREIDKKIKKLSVRASREVKSEKSNSSYREHEKSVSEINFFKYQLNNLNKILEHANVLSLIDKYASDVVELAKVLGLPRVPARIEGYDISSLYGRQAVGSMVVFINGEPARSQYRKFKIKSDDILSDVGMLKEILERRFKKIKELELLKEKPVSDKWPMPDLIIIDGGRAQLNIAMRILKEFKLDLPALAISKGRGLRSARALDKIFFPGEKKPLELSLASPALHIIKRVRDEAHRFAVLYHKKLREKRFFY